MTIKFIYHFFVEFKFVMLDCQSAISDEVEIASRALLKKENLEANGVRAIYQKVQCGRYIKKCKNGRYINFGLKSAIF